VDSLVAQPKQQFALHPEEVGERLVQRVRQYDYDMLLTRVMPHGYFSAKLGFGLSVILKRRDNTTKPPIPP
jgi:hypothetical protein